MRQVRFDIVGGASRPTDCEEEGVGYASISDAECACGEQGCPISSGSRVSYGIVMTVTENGGSETVKFPDISFSEKNSGILSPCSSATASPPSTWRK